MNTAVVKEADKPSHNKVGTPQMEKKREKKKLDSGNERFGDEREQGRTKSPTSENEQMKHNFFLKHI